MTASPGVSVAEMATSGGSASCAVLSTLAVGIAPLIFGMSLGFTGPAIDVMQNTVEVDGVHLQAPDHLVVFSSKDEGSLFGAIVNIGALLGALLGGPLSERLGRKGAMLVQAPIYALSWLLTGAVSSYATLIAARFVLGIGVGICTASVPTYIGEIAPTSMRGGFGAFFQVAVVIGIMLTYLLGAYVFVVESDNHKFCQWRQLAFTSVVAAVAFFACTLAIPESPVWLASKGRLAEARASLDKLRGGSRFAETEMTELENGSQQCSEASGGIRDLWTYRKPFIIGLALMLIQQLSGVNAVIFFQDTIFQDANMKDPAALGFYVMVLQVVMTGISIPLMDTAGRKVLVLTSALGMCTCCIGMVIFFMHSNPGWLALVSSFAYIAFFSIGLGPIPWLMMSELFPSRIRSSASSCAAAFNWMCSFITTKTVAPLQEAVGFSGVFGIYGVVVALGAVYIVAQVPETKGKSLAELEAMLSGQRRDVALISA